MNCTHNLVHSPLPTPFSSFASKVRFCPPRPLRLTWDPASSSWVGGGGLLCVIPKQLMGVLSTLLAFLTPLRIKQYHPRKSQRTGSKWQKEWYEERTHLRLFSQDPLHQTSSHGWRSYAGVCMIWHALWGCLSGCVISPFVLPKCNNCFWVFFVVRKFSIFEWWNAVLQKRLAWALFVLLLSTLLCCQPTELILGFFLFHIFSSFTFPPPSHSWRHHCGLKDSGPDSKAANLEGLHPHPCQPGGCLLCLLCLLSTPSLVPPFSLSPSSVSALPVKQWPCHYSTRIQNTDTALRRSGTGQVWHSMSGGICRCFVCGRYVSSVAVFSFSRSYVCL